MKFLKKKSLYILVAFLILLGVLLFFSQIKRDPLKDFRKQYVQEVNDFKGRGSMNIVSVVTYNGTKTYARPEEEEKIIAVELQIQPRDVSLSIEDLQIDNKEGKILSYGWPEINLDNKDRDPNFKQLNKDSFVVLFLVPKNFEEGSLIYSDKKFAEIKLSD